jgi:hypothetical protein
MGFGKRSGSQGRGSGYVGQGPPAWLVFLVGMALVFGVYYIWIGVQDYIALGARSVQEATREAQSLATATAIEIDVRGLNVTPRPTFTPIPECQDFAVIVDAAIVRQGPTTGSQPLASLSRGEMVCVIERRGDWYLIDNNPATRRIDEAYMFFNIIEAMNPTPTPTNTYTPAPTVTEEPTLTPSVTPSPAPTATPDPDATDTPTPTPTTTPTVPVQSI